MMLLNLSLVCLFDCGQLRGSDYNPHAGIPFAFVAAILNSSNSEIVATAAVISPHWVLTSAHPLLDDRQGIPASKYQILAGRPLMRYYPSHVLTHPAYTWSLYTAEDLALFYVPQEISSPTALVLGGRFPWNKVECSFIYWNDTKYPFVTSQPLKFFKNDITVVQNCLVVKHKIPIGLLEFYMNDILCGSIYELPSCVGRTGGLLYCENFLVGTLIRQTWCENKTANFTDLGAFSNWIKSRAVDAQFKRLTASAHSARLGPYTALLIALASFVLLGYRYHQTRVGFPEFG